MEHNPSSEANSHLASQEIPLLLYNPKFRYRVRKSPPLAPILSQMHPLYAFSPSFPKIHSNIIFPSMSRSSRVVYSFPSFRLKFDMHFCLSYACYVPRPYHPNNM